MYIVYSEWSFFFIVDHTHGTTDPLSWRKIVVNLKGSGEMFTGELNSAKD